MNTLLGGRHGLPPAAAAPVRPGPVWGPYPQRSGPAPGMHANLGQALWRARPAGPLGRRACARMLHWPAATPAAAADMATALNGARAALLREGFSEAAVRAAFVPLGALCQATLGYHPHPNQFLAAWVMLQGGMAELDTGEGKTVVAGLAAATAALAGTPVHVFTSNDYLVQRDADSLAPFYAALKLSVGHVTQASTVAQRQQAYAADITYCTAKELAFDYLRDHMATQGRRDDMAQRLRGMRGSGSGTLLRGLCMALVDEADSILIDEAQVPLVISGPTAAATGADDASVWQRALQLAATLEEGRHWQRDGNPPRTVLSEAGEAVLQAACAADAGPWAMAARRQELVALALQAQQLMQRDRDYVVMDAQVVLVDPLTGRPSPQRQWAQGLHQMLALKEGLAPPAPLRTLAQITYQLLFPRYHHLAGMSGTLRSARAVLAALYGTPVRRVQPHQPSRRRFDGVQCLADEARLWPVVAARAQAVTAQGRAVLVGTDSVADSLALAAALKAAGAPHRVLNARQDALENQIIAGAGQAGRITVATQMAGRGTDIRPVDSVLGQGGLHVICCQHEGTQRLQRQMLGRAARQGQCGSGEVMLAAGRGVLARHLGPLAALPGRGRWPAAALRLAQALEEAAGARALWRLRRSDAAWRRAVGFAGEHE